MKKNHCEPIVLTLVGLDSNAFALMGAWKREAKKQGRTAEEVKAVLDDCMSGDYNHLVSVLSDHSVESEEEEPCDVW
jgi:hypothetical protein